MLGRLHHLALRVFRRLPVRLRRWVVRRISPNYTVGAVMLIERADGQVLLVRQSYRRGWGAPGGLLKWKESAEEAVCREVLEETGLGVVVVGGPAVVLDAPAQRIDIVFRGRVADGWSPETARPTSPEITEVGWFPSDELPDLQHETTTAFMALARQTMPRSVD